MIWVFGDSFSAEFESHLKTKNKWAIDYCEYLKKTPKVYGQIISEMLDITYTNISVPGSDNYTIFHSYINLIDKIKKDDILIFGWSNTLRYRIGNNEGGFCTILAENNIKEIEHLFDNTLSNKTIDEMLLIRDSVAYYRELEDFIKIIKKSCKSNHIYNWSPFPNLRKNIKNIEKIAPRGIDAETNFKINDCHYGEIGHLSVAMYFYKKIKYKQ
jgi:hypothetical protein